MLRLCCLPVGVLAYLLASSSPCAGEPSTLQAMSARKVLQAPPPDEVPAFDNLNSIAWQVGGNASLTSVSLDALQQSTTVSSMASSFSEAPNHPGAKRRLLQGCSCAACPHTQSIPAQASYSLTFSSANVIDLNIQSTDVRLSAK